MRSLRFKVLILVLIVCVGQCNIISAKAETSGDLRALYGGTEKERLQDIQAEYEKLLLKLQISEDDISAKEQFNMLLANAESYVYEQCRQIDLEVEKILASNRILQDKIEAQFYDDFSVLVNLDIECKQNSAMLESLLEQKNKYQLTSAYDIDYAQRDELEQECLEIAKEYEALDTLSELGDVTNIKFPLGLPSEIRSRYGNRIDPMDHSKIQFHKGVDLKASMNTPVLSVFNGIVADTGWGPLGGYYVWINHGDNIRSYYCHLETITCKVGQEVKQYEQIALSGNTGSRTTGPHLHFGLYMDGNSVDPAILFEQE